MAISGRKLSEEHKAKISAGVKKNLPSSIFKKGYIPDTCFKEGNIPWNKGIELPKDMKSRISFGRRGKMIGENHPRWIQDRSLVKVGDRKLNDPMQKQWRRSVKNRDCWVCRLKDSNCNGKLEAHHILPWSEFPELRYQISNGITLCRFHHPRKKKDVEELSSYFKQLVADV